MAELLDEMGIRWEYEPHLFVLETNGDGHCKEGFQPDFFLPDHGVYLEVTMAKVQTPKNRKIRKMRELYPEVVIHLFGRASFDSPRAALREMLA